MSVNTLNFEQVSTVLTSIVKQATGQTVLTATDTGSFTSVGPHRHRHRQLYVRRANRAPRGP